MQSSRSLGVCFAVVLVTALMLVAVTREASAAAYASAGTGAWDEAATWSPAGVPGPGDTVTIEAGHTVSVTTPTTVDGVAVNAGGVLTVSSTLTVNGGVNVAGTGSITNNGTLSITGALSGAGALTQGINATLALSGAAAPTITTLNTTSSMPNTVRYDGGVQTAASIAYSNLAFAGTGAKTWVPSTVNGAFTLSGTATYNATGVLTIGGDLNVQGGTLSVANTIQVNGATTLSGGGILAITSVTGTKTFVGDVTINGGTWDNGAVAEPVALSGSLIYVAGTFTSGTGVYTMTGDGAALSGALTVQALTVQTTGRVTAFGNPTVGALVVTLPATVTNDGALRVATSLTGTGTLINAANRTLFYDGTAAPTALFDMISNTPNTVNYSRNDGAAQAIRGTTDYHHLTLSGSGAKTGATSVTVRGQFTLGESATWTPGTAVVSFLGDMVVDTDQAVPITAAAGTNLTWDTPDPAVATGITGTTAQTIALTIMNFNNVAGVSSSKTINPTTVTVGGGASFTNNGTFTPTTLTVSGASTFTNNQTLTAGALTVNGGGTFTNAATGTATVTGTTSVGSTGAFQNFGTTNANGLISGAGTLTNRANAILNFGMAAANVPTITNLALTTHTPNTVVYTLAGAQSIRAGAYSNLELANSGIKTALGTLTVNGTFTLSGTAAFTTGAFTHHFAGSWVHDSAVATPLVATGSTINFNAPTPSAATSIGGAGGNTLAFAAVNVNTTAGLTVNKTITSTGPLTVNGLLTNGATGSITMLSAGGITVANGATLSNTGVADLTSGGTVIVGPSGAATLTNTGTLTVGGLIDGQGTLTNGAAGTLNYQNATAPTLATMDFSTHASNTVNYSLAGAQTLRSGSYRNLGLTTSGTKTAAGALTVSGTMTLSGTAGFAPLGFTHTFGGNWVHGLTTTVTPGGVLIFTGANAQISGAGTLAVAEVRIASGATVESFIAMTATTLVVVQTGGTLTLNGTVSGVGAFTVEAGATLGIRSAAGIAAVGASGNVQTSGARTFSADASYRYNNNSGNPQVTGSGLPATVRNLVIDNPQGVTLSAAVTTTEDLTLTAGALSNPGATVTATVLPVVSGTLTVGQTLTTTDGTWGGAPTFTYQWQRCSASCADIDGETGNSYVLAAADSGARLRVLVTATDGGTLTVGSARTAVVGGGAPPPPPPPVSGGATPTVVPAPVPAPAPEPGLGTIAFEPSTAVVRDLSLTGPTVATSTSGDTSVTVQVPAGALADGSELRLGFLAEVDEVVRLAPPPAGVDIAAAFVAQALGPDGAVVTGDFSTPVEIDVVVPASSFPAAVTSQEIVLAFWNGSAWVVTPATITVEADGSIRARATVSHFTVFGLFTQPSSAWTGIIPRAAVSFVIWQGFTGTDPAAAAALATPDGLGIWRLDPVTQQYQSWVATSPRFVNDLRSLTSGDLVFLRTQPAAPRTPAPRPAPTATATPTATPTPTSAGQAAPVTYTVTDTDTLSQIGARFGVDWLQIAAANGISGPQYVVRSGQVLTIPASTPAAPATPAPSSDERTHLVVAGDTLSGIARRYGVPAAEIAEANDLTAPLFVVRTGQVLTIP